MNDAARPLARPKLLLVNHFALATICGTTVMFDEILRIAPRAAPQAAFAYASYEPHASADAFIAMLEANHADAACVVAVNPQIEVMWTFSEALFAWCRARGIPAYVYAHDYWPHHKDALAALIGRLGARLIASTPFVADAMRQEGFDPGVVQVGVPLPDAWPAVRPSPAPKTIASAGRMVPRKRQGDIVRAFAASGLDGSARLYLRVLPSQVFGSGADDALWRGLEDEIARANLSGVTLDPRAGDLPDYADYAAYVCSSSYEGFSMTVIEAAFHGCPPLMSDIPPHQRSAQALFGGQAADFLYPVGDHLALASLMRDEIVTGRRKALVDARIDAIRQVIASRWSLQATAQALARLVPGVSG